MRGLWKAALLLTPALGLADWETTRVQGRDFDRAIVSVPIPSVSESPDVSTVLNFHIEVLASEEICGYSNLTIDGQELAQEPYEFGSTGQGLLSIDGRTIEGSWEFLCLSGSYGHYAQQLRFYILSVDGKALNQREDPSLWVAEFQQSNSPKILRALVFDDLIVEEAIPELGVPAHTDIPVLDDFENFDVEQEIEELELMKELIKDLKYQIYLKKKAIAMHLYLSEADLEECDSLKCVIRTLFSKAQVTTHIMASELYSKVTGHTDPDEAAGLSWKKHPGKKPRKKPHHPGEDHPGKKPHHPGEDHPGKKPHHPGEDHPGKKPHHPGEDHPGKKPHHPGEDHPGKKPHHPGEDHPGKKPHYPHHNITCPGKGNHSHPFVPHPPFGRRPPPFCHCLPHHRRPHHRRPHHRRPHHRRPHHRLSPYDQSEGPPGMHPHPPTHYRPSEGPSGEHPQSGQPNYRPNPSPDNYEGPPFSNLPFDNPPPFVSPDGPPFDGPASLSGCGGPHRWPAPLGFHNMKAAIKFFAVATLLLLLFVVARRCCCCSTARRQAKKALREEQHRRRAFRRAARKQAWRSWFSHHIFRSAACDSLADEEKHLRLARGSEGEDTVASEISEFRNAASVISDMVAAVEGRVSTDSRASLREYMSELGGESLPSYDSEDSLELSGVVTDGFRYTPGSSEYTPGHSDAGSASDILGDVKE